MANLAQRRQEEKIKDTKYKWNKQKITRKMVDFNTVVSIITLNTNGLNIPAIIQRLSD